MKISPSTKLNGSITVPPDKSISHRAFILSGIAKKTSTIQNILESDDVKTSLATMQKLGVGFSGNFEKMTISPFTKPKSSHLYCGNSGTTTRLVSGLVSAYEGSYEFSGDESLTTRPMERISMPLTRMGSAFTWKGKKGYLPYIIEGGTLKGIIYENVKKSAQVKSAILLAGLKAEGSTIIYEKTKTRDHTERLLSQMGADIKIEDDKIEVHPSEIDGITMTIP
ncbi:MAG: 3-phosphoshikimate 1-carboxyvinyltransferase, partial [Thermotogota bacterium]